MHIDMQARPSGDRLEPVARAGLGAMLSLAKRDGAPSERALRFIQSARDRILRVDIDLDSLAPVGPEELAEAVPETLWRERILRGMTVLAMMDGDPSPEALAFLEATASALQIGAAPVKTYRRVLEDKENLVRLDILRRGFLKEAVSAFVKNEGLRGVVTTALTILGQEDKAVAARYHTLDTYPEGSLGRAYADFITLNRFSYPGEVGGPPAPIMRHDLCHVLGGYGTTASEECAVIGFQAGFQKEDPFFILMFTIAQFELGIQASPFLPPSELEIDPDVVIAGIVHGSHVNTDIVGDPGWDPWDHFEESIADLRTALNIVPRGREPEYLEYDSEGNIIVRA
ncbi:MAG: TerB family tellurite resistance protein [Myxococcota bacterium]